MEISARSWKATAKFYRDFYHLTFAQARRWQGKCFRLQASNRELKDALADMLALIMEHGSPAMKAHATRMGKAFRAIRSGDE